jgi:hypothetical protein
MADLQSSLARLKREQDRKDQEIAAFRTRLTAFSTPRPPSSLLTGTMPLACPPSEFSLLTNKFGVPGTWKLSPTPPPAVADSFLGWAKAALLDIGAIFGKYPGLSFYFGVASLLASSKLFWRK